MRFERIDSRTIFEGRIITVREDRFRYEEDPRREAAFEALGF